MKKILILYTSVGLGHKTIAENIGYHLEQAGFSVRLEDVLKVQTQSTISSFVNIQQYINKKMPYVWQWIYQWGYIPTLPFRVFAAKFHSDAIRTLIEEHQPDLIISTQTSSSAPISYLKKKKAYTGPFAIAFSDYHFHPYWLYPGADAYLTTIPEQQPAMTKRGVTAEHTHHIGITLKPRGEVDMAKVKSKFQVLPGQKVVLIGTGSLGTSASPEFVISLVKQLHLKAAVWGVDLKIIISCGRNAELKEALEQKIGHEAIILGFYTPMEELYALADMFVTKPGGLSIAEGLLWRIPMLITHWLPGQEKLNYEYLKKRRLIIDGPANPYDLTAEKASTIILEEIKTQDFKNSLINNEFVAHLLSTNVQQQPIVSAIKSIISRFDGGERVG